MFPVCADHFMCLHRKVVKMVRSHARHVPRKNLDQNNNSVHFQKILPRLLGASRILQTRHRSFLTPHVSFQKTSLVIIFSAFWGHEKHHRLCVQLANHSKLSTFVTAGATRKASRTRMVHSCCKEATLPSIWHLISITHQPTKLEISPSRKKTPTN